MKQQLRVLMVEDSEDDVLLVTRHLQHGGFVVQSERVETADSFVSALEAREWDVILCDYKMPKFSGSKALSIVKERSIGIPFIFVSGTMGEEIAIEAMKAGAHDYVMKENLKRLVPAIERALRDAKVRKERLHAEEKIVFQATLLDQVASAAIATDLDGIIFYWNRFAETLYGWKSEEVLGKNATDIIVPKDSGSLVNEIRNRIDQGGPEESEMNLQRKDGTTVPVHLSGSVLRDASGKAVGRLGISTDITKRKRAEQALSQSEERFKLLHEYAPLGILLANRSGQILEVNPAALQILGSPSAEETKKINLLTFPLLIKSGISAAFKSCIDTGQPNFGEYPYTSKWDKTILMHLQYVPIFDDHNQVTLVHIIIEDITEHKRAEDAVRESEERFRMVFENSFDGISIYVEDPDPSKRRLVECNNQYAAMAGRTREELLKLGNTLGLQITITDTANDTPSESRLPGSAYLGTFSWIRPDGKDNIIEYTGMPIIWRGKLHSISIDRDITERKQAEEALQQSEEKHKALIETTDTGYLILDAQGRVIDANKEYIRLTGYDTLDEILGRSVVEWTAPHDLERNAIEVKKCVEQGYIRNLEIDYINRSEQITPIEINATSVGSGESFRILSLCRDITERKRAEEAFTYESNLLKSLLDTIPDHVYFKDKDCRFLRISRSQANMFGLNDPARAAGKTDFDFFAEEHARLAFEEEQKIMKSGIATEGLEEKESWPDGRQTWVSTTKVPLRNTQGEIIGTFGISRDITEHKHAEEERQRLITAFEQTIEAILVTDTRGIIQYVNPAFEQITGFTREEAVGQNPRIMKSGQQSAEFYEQLWKTISTGRKWMGRFINKKKDGTLFTDETSISPVVNEKGEIINYVGVKRDITSELSLQTQLVQAQRLESIGTLASGIAHDFNNILGIILGHSTLLERLKEDPQKLSESIKAITKATERGAGIVKQLLTFARKTEPLFESVSVNDMIREINKLVDETFAKTIILSLSLQKDLPAIVADAGQIHQVLLNLCVNARDAMPKGGTLLISTRTVEGKFVSSRFPKASARQYVQIEIADTGIGMDEATRQRIFEPFFTTKGIGKGTGLGLAVVFGIVEHNSGFIDVRSVPGKGTTFTVYFPIPERTPEVSQRVQKRLEEIAGGTETILVIEDEEMLRALAKAILISKGYTVLTAEDGQHGVEMYQSHQDKIAVVLSDIGLPILSGQDVLKRIRAINPKAKVIMASGFIDPEAKSEMYKSGVKHFIQKPYLPDEVLQKIREVIDTNQ